MIWDFARALKLKMEVQRLSSAEVYGTIYHGCDGYIPDLAQLGVNALNYRHLTEGHLINKDTPLHVAEIIRKNLRNLMSPKVTLFVECNGLWGGYEFNSQEFLTRVCSLLKKKE